MEAPGNPGGTDPDQGIETPRQGLVVRRCLFFKNSTSPHSGCYKSDP